MSQNGVSVRFLIFGRSDIILKQTSQNIISVLIHLYLNVLSVNTSIFKRPPCFVGSNDQNEEFYV